MVQAISQVDVPAASQLRMRVVAVASLISLVCIFCVFWSWMPYWEHFDRFPGLVGILPFWVPYGFVPLRLYQGRIVSGLVLAVTIGCALFVPGLFLMRFVIEWQRSWWIGTNLAVAVLMQPVMVVAAVRALKFMQIALRDWRKILGGCGIYGIVLVAIFVLAYSPTPRRIIDSESGAERWLRAIYSRNDWHYREEHYFDPAGSSLPTGKMECGSDDPFWPYKPAMNGYNFEYRAVASETSERGCRFDTSFIITARPVAYRKTGIRSFLVYRHAQDDKWPQDRYIRIHFTSEDRPATPSDPADEFEVFDLRSHRPA